MNPTNQEIVMMAGAILGQPEGTADNRHPLWLDAVAQAERAYAALAVLRSMPAEPVAWYDVEDGQIISAPRWYSDGGRTEAPLYATPPAAPVLSEAWISVDERLPKPWEDVLIYPRPTDYCCEGQVDHKGQWSYSEYEMNFGDVKHKIKPTHWMPLPPPPAAALAGDTGEAG